MPMKIKIICKILNSFKFQSFKLCFFGNGQSSKRNVHIVKSKRHLRDCKVCFCLAMLPISKCIVRADMTLLWNLKYILKKAMGHLRVKNSENLKESIKELSANMSISPFFELWKS